MNFRNIDKSHGIMFHHFHHLGEIPTGQGSITPSEFELILDEYSKSFNLLNAQEYYLKLQKGTLSKKDVCITFDDGLKSQFDIAFPILQKRKLSAFWFIYTSPLEGIAERFEVYRFFRLTAFENVDHFYAIFEEALQASEFADEVIEKISGIDFNAYLQNFRFYSLNDRKFRYIRDYVLGQEKYYLIMDKMIEKHQLDTHSLIDTLWMNKEHVKCISAAGHTIGLHTHTHPTNIENLLPEDQRKEYFINNGIMKKIIEKDLLVAAHPNGSYSHQTLDILKDLGVNMAFRSNMALENYSNLELPRVDHSDIMKQLRSGN